MRLSAAAAALFGALFLGAAVAHADPGFVLTESQARPGDKVHFSISGMEDEAAYVLEIGDELVAEGSDLTGSRVSGEFTMPDLGNTSRAVTVEAQITQSDETTTRERDLQYLAPSQAGNPIGPPSTTVLTLAPAARSSPAGQPALSSQQGEQRASRAPEKRRGRRSPGRVRKQHSGERRVSGRRRSTRADDGHRGRGSPGSSSKKRTSAPSPKPRSNGVGTPLSSTESENRPPSGPREILGTDVTRGLSTFLTGPPTGIFSLASGVATDSPGEFPVAALIILPLLCLAALLLVGGGFAPRQRSGRFTFVPGSRSAPGNTPESASANGRTPTPASREGHAAGQVRLSDAEIEAMAITLQDAATSFAPIPLAVLDQRAELSTRAERKYILDVRNFERFVGELIPNYLILEIAGARVFPYDTVYFDTPALITYHQHLQERRRRFKCRSRLYSANGPCFFEVKLKGGRGETIKSRLGLAVEEHGSLTAPALAFLEHELNEAYGASAPVGLAPALRTSYRRLTLVGRTGAERLTFDFELMFAADGQEHSIQPGRILLETKFDTGTGEAGGGAGEAKRLLRRLGVRPVGSCSKYCLGVALAHPELHNNLFRPLLRRHFDAHRHAPSRVYDRTEVAPPVPELEAEWQAVRASPTWQGVLAQLTRRSSA